jgi:hypothetical protein
VATSDRADTAPPEDLDAAIAALYGGPLDEFVAGRDALARTLRTAGRTDEAAAVRKLPKPKRLAWALDAAVLADREAFEAVDAAAESLAGARSGSDVREATSALRTAARALADVASDRAAAAGGAALDQSELVPAVLAVAADPEALGALRAGRLVDVPSAGAFGAFAPAPGAGSGRAPATRPAARRTPDGAAEVPSAPPAGRGRARSRELKAADRDVERAEANADAARTRAEDAADAADRAAADLAAAEDRRREAQREVEAARERLDAARREARRAAAEAEEAENAISEARAARSSLE